MDISVMNVISFSVELSSEYSVLTINNKYNNNSIFKYSF